MGEVIEVIAELLGGLARAAAAAAVHVGGGFVRWLAEVLGVELWERWERRDEEEAPAPRQATGP